MKLYSKTKHFYTAELSQASGGEALSRRPSSKAKAPNRAAQGGRGSCHSRAPFTLAAEGTQRSIQTESWVGLFPKPPSHNSNNPVSDPLKHICGAFEGKEQ